MATTTKADTITPATPRPGLRAALARLANGAGLILLAVGMVACSPADEAGRAATSVIDTGADSYFDAHASTLGEIEVEVRLHDDSLEMAPSLPQGRVTFVVVNESHAPHGFAIAGRGIEEAVDTIAPGDMAELSIDLEPGVYRVHTPQGGGDGGHDEAGEHGHGGGHGGHGDEGPSRWLRVVH